MHASNLARITCKAAAALLVAAVCSAQAQQPYPSKAVRIINPLAPGGTTDITARTLAPQLSTFLGQPVLVENRTGAGGVVGAEFVAKSPPDGYTLLLMSGDSYNVNAAVYPKLPFDARKDLKPVTLLAASPNMLSVHPSLPVKSVKELVALSKTRPKELNYGVGGTAGLIRMEMLKMNTGLMITNVPYKGSGPALIDLMAGHIHAGFFNSVATIPYVQSGRLRGLMLSGTKRSERVSRRSDRARARLEGLRRERRLHDHGAERDAARCRRALEQGAGARAPDAGTEKPLRRGRCGDHRQHARAGCREAEP